MADGLIVLKADVTIQTRRAQHVGQGLAVAIQHSCESCPEISHCYLLDARLPDRAAPALILALTLEGNPRWRNSRFRRVLASELVERNVMANNKFARSGKHRGPRLAAAIGIVAGRTTGR